MYPGKYALQHPGKAAFIMANSGETVTYAELEARSNRLAHLLRADGLQRLDHYAIFMENNSRYIEACAAGARAGLYYTCVNSFLTAEELAYILNNSESKVLITSRAKLEIAAHALKLCPDVRLCLVADAAVFGIPNEDLGEEVKAVVQPMPGIDAGPALEQELIAFSQQHLAILKCPKSIDFDPALPRLPTGKLYKKRLRDRYWVGKKSRIV